MVRGVSDECLSQATSTHICICARRLARVPDNRIKYEKDHTLLSNFYVTSSICKAHIATSF